MTVMVTVNAEPVQLAELVGVTTYVAVSAPLVVLVRLSVIELAGPPADPPVTLAARVGALHE